MNNIAKTNSATPTIDTTPVVRTGETPNVVQAEGVKRPQAASEPVGVRNALNNMGFNDTDIGFDNGNVTYKGSAVVQPSYVKDGISYAPESANYAGAVDYLKQNGYKGVRSELNNRGIVNDRIGWNNDTGAVTIDGHDIAKPQYNVDGTVYATDAEINQIYNTAAGLAGDRVVAARDYTMSQTAGAGNSVDWDGENVLIGGQPIKAAYVQDGVAYVLKSQIDPLISNYKEDNGLMNGQQIISANDLEYKARKDKELDDILNRKEFSYDLDSDKIWGDHENRMMSLADEAYRRVLNDNNTSVTGASGAVLAEANAAKNNYLKAIADDAYTYRQDAYNRYVDEYGRDRNDLNDIHFASDSDYNRAYTNYRDDVSDTYNNNVINNQEKWNWRNYDLSLQENDRANNENARNVRYYDIQNDTNAFNYGVSVASLRGRFLPQDEAYIPGLANFRNSDGTYSITPTQFEELYTEAIARASARGQYLGYNDVYGY